MALVCDACGEKYGHDSVNASLRVSPFRPDFKLFQALAAAGRPYESQEPLAVDLCIACTKKTLAHLGLPTAICELPQLPDTDEKTESPLTGQLSEEELRKLGMTDDDLRQLGIGPKG